MTLVRPAGMIRAGLFAACLGFSTQALAAPLLVIDPGHGGTDSGVSIGQMKESEVVLDVAKRLQRQLKDMGIEASLSRSDADPGLQERAAAANVSGARALLSLHVNNSPSSQVRGARVFVPKALAAGLGATDWGHAASGQSQEARKLGTFLAESLASPEFPKVGVQALNLAPFRGLRIPAVLVELDFASNPASLKNLGSPDFRQALSTKLATGIKAWAGAP